MPPSPLPAPRESTHLESDEEIRRVLAARRAALRGVVGEQAPPREKADDTPPFRPTLRPAVAMLCIADDGRNSGEWVRLRAERYVIGRTTGDIIIPHDELMSGRHAELRRWSVGGQTRWSLTDLDSTNGTFVRVSSALVREGQEFLVGRTRLRLEKPRPDAAPPLPQPGERGTQPWRPSSSAGSLPAVVFVTATDDGPRVPLTGPEVWVGRDARRCAICPPDDPFVSPLHARLFRDDRGRWCVENRQSPNGVWLRIDQPLSLDTTCQFLLGEQRFFFRVPPAAP